MSPVLVCGWVTEDGSQIEASSRLVVVVVTAGGCAAGKADI